jgi:folate-dependent phosphoribosylglycinamide formyltransferase PurN
LKTLLICHENDPLNRIALARWMATFSELSGIISLTETPQRVKKRVRREIDRVGYLRFMDVVAFRLYYRIRLADSDKEWERQKLEALCAQYPPVTNATPVLATSTPNNKESETFVRAQQPDIILARCKTLLAERVFSQARIGTFVMHPGICPDYRNSHGCFWALASGDLENVGMTLLKVDHGIDTGPVYAYFRAPYDESSESHIVVQHRTVFDNLPAIRSALESIAAGKSVPIDTRGRSSREWGQPWLSKYIAWKRDARRR